jgi:hypothetical protein
MFTPQKTARAAPDKGLNGPEMAAPAIGTPVKCALSGTDC